MKQLTTTTPPDKKDNMQSVQIPKYTNRLQQNNDRNIQATQQQITIVPKFTNRLQSNHDSIIQVRQHAECPNTKIHQSTTTKQ